MKWLPESVLRTSESSFISVNKKRLIDLADRLNKIGQESPAPKAREPAKPDAQRSRR